MDLRALVRDLADFFPAPLDPLGWDGGALFLGAIALAVLTAIFKAVVNQLEKRLTRMLEKDHLFALSLIFVVPAFLAVAVGRWWTALIVALVALALFFFHLRWRIQRIGRATIVGLLIAMLVAFWTEGRLQRWRVERTGDAETVFAVLTFTGPGQGAQQQADLLVTTREFHSLLRDSFSVLPATVFRPAEIESDEVLKRWRLPDAAFAQLNAEGRGIDVVLQNYASPLQSAPRVPPTGPAAPSVSRPGWRPRVCGRR